MKSILKSTLLIMFLTAILFALTGCGGSKLVATKTNDNDSFFGKHEEKIEITFKDKKADKMKQTLIFDSKDDAKKVYDLYNSGIMEDIKVEQKGKKVILTMNVKDFMGEEDTDEALTKDVLKKELESDGYKVK